MLNICMKEFGSECFFFFFDKMTSMIFSLIRLLYIELLGVNNFVYLILTNVPDCKL